jgi:excisionase family DNA binding protein
MTPSTTPRLLYDRKEAARQLSVSIRSIDYMIAGKQIDARRIGSRILIPHEELVRLATSARIRSVV